LNDNLERLQQWYVPHIRQKMADVGHPTFPR
jgi:hypothetical protein